MAKHSQPTGRPGRSDSSSAAAKRAKRRSAATAALFAYDRSRGDLVVGADEAGRGCLAGPIVAAAVCIDHGRLSRSDRLKLAGLNDSKQLSRDERERLYGATLRVARCSAISVCAPASIDGIGLHRSNLLVLRAAVTRVCGALDGQQSVRLVDGYSLNEPEAPAHEALPRGDSTSAAVAAASVLAKVTRDDLMRSAAERFPEWGFEDHVGYASESHLAAIEAHGPSPIHRMSFRCSAYPSDAESEGTGQMLVFDDVS